jgi:transposase
MPSITLPAVRVAIDVAKLIHQVLLELPNGKRRVLRVANTRSEIDRLVTVLSGLALRCEIAFEPTGDYHRPIAYALGQAGFHLSLVSSLAVARTREALFNSWDKNDPKDAQVILHLLKNGTTQRYLDPVVTGHHDLQEMANTYQQVSLRKVRLHHSLLTHHLPLYFPEAERYLHSSRAEWFNVNRSNAFARRWRQATRVSTAARHRRSWQTSFGSAAMSMVGDKTESICRRYATVDEAMQREAAARLDAFTATPQPGNKTGTVKTFRPKVAKVTRPRRERSA